MNVDKLQDPIEAQYSFGKFATWIRNSNEQDISHQNDTNRTLIFPQTMHLLTALYRHWQCQLKILPPMINIINTTTFVRYFTPHHTTFHNLPLLYNYDIFSQLVKEQKIRITELTKSKQEALSQQKVLNMFSPKYFCGSIRRTISSTQNNVLPKLFIVVNYVV